MNAKRVLWRWRFYFSYASKHRTWLLTAFVHRWFWKHFPHAEYEGVRITDLSLRQESSQEFLDATVSALELIKAVDSRRFQRVRREIKYINNAEGLALACYRRALRECEVDYSRFRCDESLEWSKWRYATTLVHEATHGAVYSRWIDYAKANRLRIERLCRREEKRFARRANTSERRWSEALAPDLDEQNLRSWWNRTRYQRFTQAIARLRAIWNA